MNVPEISSEICEDPTYARFTLHSMRPLGKKRSWWSPFTSPKDCGRALFYFYGLYSLKLLQLWRKPARRHAEEAEGQVSVKLHTLASFKTKRLKLVLWNQNKEIHGRSDNNGGREHDRWNHYNTYVPISEYFIALFGFVASPSVAWKKYRQFYFKSPNSK